MSGTDAILSNVNGILDISGLLDTGDHSVFGDSDQGRLHETALHSTDMEALPELQTATELDVSVLRTNGALSLDQETELVTAVNGTNDSLTGLSATAATLGDLQSANTVTYESGVFTVDASGQVSVDFLFDGGGYQSELAMFSLSGMDAYETGSAEFIQEAARRALSNSALGYVVISDREEGARFDGILGEHEIDDWNGGEYLGVKSFAMNPGDHFGFMLTVKDNVQKIFDNPNRYLGMNQPLFSMAEANPGGKEQIADISGDQNTFGFEDLQIHRKSDRDFNDIIFKLEGTNGGGAFHIEELVDETVDWRNSEVGQELIQFAVDPLDLAGNTIVQSHNVQTSSFGRTYRGWVGNLDLDDYYSFVLGARSQFDLSLSGLNADVNIELFDSAGNVILRSGNIDTSVELTGMTLDSGIYRVRVESVDTIGTPYDLELVTNPLINGITTTGSEEQEEINTNASRSLVKIDEFRSGNPALGSDSRFSGIDGASSSIVILDSGINLNHPYFGPDNDGDGISDRIVFSWDLTRGNAVDSDNDGALDPIDIDGDGILDVIDANRDLLPDAIDTFRNAHGTNVSSIAAAEDTIPGDGGDFTGVAPGANIIHLKVFPDDPGAPNPLPVAARGTQEAALQWVIENAATFNITSVNLSLGGGNFNSFQTDGRSDEFQVLSDLGIVTVASSGNNFFLVNSAQGVEAPSADPNVLSIGAVWDGNNGGPQIFQSGATDITTASDRIASFSQRSQELTTIFAPGATITGAGLNNNPTNPGFTSALNGTSQAAPHIAGMAALAQQLAIQELGRRLTPEEFESLIKSTGDVINDGDDENDNVVNTGSNFRRANMLNLGDAIINLNTVEVEINGVRGDFDPDGVVKEGPNRGDSDFYAIVSIGNTDEKFDGKGVGEWKTDVIDGSQHDSYLEDPGWIFRRGAESENVPIRIAILDKDEGVFNDDERVDLNPNPRPSGESGKQAKRKYKDLLFNLNLVTGSVTDSTTGQYYGQAGQEIYLQGDGSDGSAGEVWFTIKGWSAQSTNIEKPVTLAVHRVLGDFDSSPFNESDFYVTGNIGNRTFSTLPVSNVNDLRPEWHFTTETSNNIVPISLNLFDEEDNLLSDTDVQIDINPRIESRGLDLVYDRNSGEIRDSLTGEVYGDRGELIKLGDPEDESMAQIWFSVFGPA